LGAPASLNFDLAPQIGGASRRVEERSSTRAMAPSRNILQDAPSALLGMRDGAIRLVSVLVSMAWAALLSGGAAAADLPAEPPPIEPPVTSCFASLYDFIMAGPDDCPLTWKGVTFYGRLDYGAGYETHGAPFNGNYPNGVDTLIKKNSNLPRYTIVPNGLGQSNIGVKGREPIASDWSLVFKFENGFDPFTLQRANGPKSLVENNTNPIGQQTANGDSSRAGQLFNTEGYAGLSHPTFGTLTAGRQNSLILQGLGDYDAMGAAPAFSVIGVSNTAGGGGDTENARYNTAAKYDLSAGPLRFAALYQFGGFDQGNGSNGAISAEVEAHLGPFAFDAVGQKVKDAVSLSNFAQYPLPPGVPANGLKATLSDKASGLLAWRYEFQRTTIYSGWEYILFANPSDAYPDGFTAIGNYPVPAGYVNSTAYTEHKILRIFWTGIRYAIRDDLDIAGSYYHYYQNDYNTSPCTDGGLSASSCRGALNAYSAMIDWRPMKRVTAYGGFMWSQVTGGLASGYLYRVNIAPSLGVRVEF
jgi:predicted porin